MNQTTQEYVRPGHEKRATPGFPHAPSDWSREQAEAVAREQGLVLTDTHWQVVRALQELCAHNDETTLNARNLHDALDEHFHLKGGIKYLYELFPQGPLAQGCLLAGLQPPAGTQDKGMGSAV